MGQMIGGNLRSVKYRKTSTFNILDLKDSQESSNQNRLDVGSNTQGYEPDNEGAKTDKVHYRRANLFRQCRQYKGNDTECKIEEEHS